VSGFRGRLEVGENLRKVQKQLGHRHVTSTQRYDKRWRKTSWGALHPVPI
jgi:site-specific recombinase XerD